MQAVIFMGLQASGKSTFYHQCLAATHLRINLDMLKTRRRETALLHWCLAYHMRFVSDNTNPTPEGRQGMIQMAKSAQFEVIGYYFRSNLEECLARNVQRTGKAMIPEGGIYGTASKLTLPRMEEGFDKLYYVALVGQQFIVEDWQTDEV